MEQLKCGRTSKNRASRKSTQRSNRKQKNPHPRLTVCVGEAWQEEMTYVEEEISKAKERSKVHLAFNLIYVFTAILLLTACDAMKQHDEAVLAELRHFAEFGIVSVLLWTTGKAGTRTLNEWKNSLIKREEHDS